MLTYIIYWIFTELEQTIQKFIWNHKRSKISKAIWRRKSQVGGIDAPRPQATLQSHSHQDSVLLVPQQTERLMEQTREPRNEHWCLWSFNLWHCRPEHKMGRRESFQPELLGILDSYTNQWTLTPCTKINSKWMNVLSIRQDTFNLLEEYIGKIFSYIKLMNISSGQSPKATEIKAKINNWGLIKPYNILHIAGKVRNKSKIKMLLFTNG